MRFQRATSHESEMFSSRFREAGRSVQRKLGRQSEEPVPYSEEMGGRRLFRGVGRTSDLITSRVAYPTFSDYHFTHAESHSNAAHERRRLPEGRRVDRDDRPG